MIKLIKKLEKERASLEENYISDECSKVDKNIATMIDIIEGLFILQINTGAGFNVYFAGKNYRIEYPTTNDELFQYRFNLRSCAKDIAEDQLDQITHAVQSTNSKDDDEDSRDYALMAAREDFIHLTIALESIEIRSNIVSEPYAVTERELSDQQKRDAQITNCYCFQVHHCTRRDD